MSDILPTLYKFIYGTLIKVSMLNREKMLQVRLECLTWRVFFSINEMLQTSE